MRPTAPPPPPPDDDLTDDERRQLHDDLAASILEFATGQARPATAVLADLRARRR